MDYADYALCSVEMSLTGQTPPLQTLAPLGLRPRVPKTPVRCAMHQSHAYNRTAPWAL